MPDNPNLGHLITTEAARDAVHVAVAPVTAGYLLAPGQRVGFIDDGKELVGPDLSPVGIIDPFLESLVMPGQKIWLFLFPGSISSLRHDWTHPAFEKKPVGEPVAQALVLAAQPMAVANTASEEDDEDDEDGCKAMGCRS